MGKQMSRRKFLRLAAKAGIAAGVATALPWGCSRGGSVWGSSPTIIRKFVTSLPGVGPSGANTIGQYLPLATKNTQTFAGLSTDVYNLRVGQFTQTMHPDLPKATTFWGYHDLSTNDQQYLAGVIVAKRGTPVMLNITNQLPNKSIIPVDPTAMAGPNGLMVQDLPMNRIANHLHGGFSPWFSDGTPMQWFDPNGRTGPSFMNVPGTNPAAGTATYYYPMAQSARLMWYHDHAMGITRTNAYSGIASALIVVDDFETGLVNQGLLPDLVGIPLIIQDKGFVPHNILDLDPDWQWGLPGDLWYPHAYIPNVFADGSVNPKGRVDWGPTVEPPSQGTLPLPALSLVPEAFFDTILVNGGVFPFVNVPPKRVRFRVLNASQARFFHLNLYAEDPSNPGGSESQYPRPDHVPGRDRRRLFAGSSCSRQYDADAAGSF
jgi:FtsP/CotA-like multicopper oxidase with cupredoxin domain